MKFRRSLDEALARSPVIFFMAVFVAEATHSQGTKARASSAKFLKVRASNVGELDDVEGVTSAVEIVRSSNSNAYPVISIAHVVLKIFGVRQLWVLTF
jgi:hypothetical protein